MAPSAKFIALIVDGITEVHAAGDGVYATLCGLDGDDYDQALVPLPHNPKIDCVQCRAQWKAWQRFTAKDFVS